MKLDSMVERNGKRNHIELTWNKKYTSSVKEYLWSIKLDSPQVGYFLTMCAAVKKFFFSNAEKKLQKDGFAKTFLPNLS